MSRVFDEAFKKMAVELSMAKGSVVETAKELGIECGSLSKWRNNPRFNGGHPLADKPGLSAEAQENRRLLKRIKDTELENEILKKALAIKEFCEVKGLPYDTVINFIDN